MATRTESVNIGNYVSVSEILRVLEENGVSPEDAEIEVDTYTEYDSLGGEYPSSQVFLKFRKRD